MAICDVLFIGGSGLLGREVQKHRPEWLYPTHAQCDVENVYDIETACQIHEVKTVVHAAAFITVPKCEKNPMGALLTNIMGTGNVVQVCMEQNIRLVYISTDYVFDGIQGIYSEDKYVNPISKYGWSKLGGECAVKMHDNSLIIRTSFGPEEFPYPGAYSDQWTSKEPVSIIAPKIITASESTFTGIINIGGKRQSTFQYAKSISPTKDIKPLSRFNADHPAPYDTSLNTRLYDSLFTRK
jgi:dTDP-4-dehydrorhamnose reductase